MPKCQHPDCPVTSAKRIQDDGYCEKHSLEMANQQSYSKSEFEALKAENATLRSLLKEATGEIVKLSAGLNDVRASINTSNYERDALEQYNRLESYRIIEAEEDPIKYDSDGNIVDEEDCAALAIKSAELLGVTLKRKGIQRCHRIGKAKSVPDGERSSCHSKTSTSHYQIEGL